MHLVIGSTGLLGGQICRGLAGKGQPIKALVRTGSDPAKRRELEAMGAAIAVGDLKDRGSLAAACQGVSTVISTASSTFSRQENDSIETVDRRGHLDLIEVAKAAGVKRFIYTSFRLDVDPGVDYPLKSAKREVEKQLVGSGIEYTIIQPSCFMEVWLTPALGFDYPSAKVRIYGAGNSPLSWVSTSDVARLAIASIENPVARNAVIELGGPEPLSPLEVVRIFERVSERKFAVEHISIAALEAQKAAAIDPLQESFAGLMLRYVRGDAIDMSETLSKFPMDLVSVEDYALEQAGRIEA